MTEQQLPSSTPNIDGSPFMRCLLSAVLVTGTTIPVVLLLELIPMQDVPAVGVVVLVMAFVGAQYHERILMKSLVKKG